MAAKRGAKPRPFVPWVTDGRQFVASLHYATTVKPTGDEPPHKELNPFHAVALCLAAGWVPGIDDHGQLWVRELKGDGAEWTEFTEDMAQAIRANTTLMVGGTRFKITDHSTLLQKRITAGAKAQLMEAS